MHSDQKNSLRVLSCKIARGKGNLQVESARVCVHVQRLAAKIQPFDQFALHGFWIDLLDVNSARGDNCLSKAP